MPREEIRIPFGKYELVIPEDDDEAIKVLDKFLAGLEKLRDRFPMVTDEVLTELKAMRDTLVRDVEKCKIADAEVDRTKRELAQAREAEAKSRAAYELELERHITRQAQAGVSKALQAKKPRFND